MVEGEELYESAADLARVAVGPAGVPVGGLPTGQAVQGVAGGGFKQSLVGTLLLGARGQAGDQLAHLLQVTWDQHQKTTLQAGTGQDKSVQFASAGRGSKFQSVNSPWHSHYSIIHEETIFFYLFIKMRLKEFVTQKVLNPHMKGRKTI